MSVAYKRKKKVQSTEADIEEFEFDESDPIANLQVERVIDEIESDLDRKNKKKSKIEKSEKSMELLISSTLVVGEEIQKTNKKLDALIKIQTYNNIQVAKNLDKKLEIELQQLGTTTNRTTKNKETYIEPPKASKTMNKFCFVQAAIILFLIFATIGIILGNGIGWMGIKVENCIYLSCMITGLLIFISIFNLLVFICMKKCYYKQNENYFRI